MSAVLVIAFDAEGRFLLVPGDDGTWALPGGECGSGELPRQAAVRTFETASGVRVGQLRYWGDAPRRDASPVHVYVTLDAVPEAAGLRYWSLEACTGLQPAARSVLEAVAASAAFRGWARQPVVVVIALSRWGRALLVSVAGGALTLPAGPMRWNEAPDGAALRRFREVTGHRLEELSLFEVQERDDGQTWHIYFCDPDLAADELNDEDRSFHYPTPDDLDAHAMEPWVRALLVRFFASTHYRALFH